MGKMQRNKGAVYERDIAAHFSWALGSVFKRNIGQARDGGQDMMVGPLVVECKRRKTLTTIEGWLKQARAAGDKMTPAEHFPVVVCRADAGTSMVILSLDDFTTLAGPELKRRIEVTR